MKKILLLMAMMLLAVNANVNAQEKRNEKEDFTVVDKMPQYPGGISAMMLFLSKNIEYPKELVKEGVEGRVFVSFVISEKGTIENVKVMRQVHPLLDNEAIRVVKLMPKWTPGEQKGEKVRVKYSLPVDFKLNKKGKK